MQEFMKDVTYSEQQVKKNGTRMFLYLDVFLKLSVLDSCNGLKLLSMMVIKLNMHTFTCTSKQCPMVGLVVNASPTKSLPNSD